MLVGRETILFVDDEEALIWADQQLLERLGYKVDAITSPVLRLSKPYWHRRKNMIW